MSTFDRVSEQYAKKSLVQQNAAARLIGLLDIKETNDVIDVACGPGNITRELKSITKGRVVGTDISEGMIIQAKQKYPGIEFVEIAAENLQFESEFDVVFCNSAFQWFKDPEKAIRAMCRALRHGGKMGVACPGTKSWSPFFIKAIGNVAGSKDIKTLFKHWKNPWFFLDTKEKYKEFFEAQGFKTLFLSVEYETKLFSVEDAFGVYLSGAANGFTQKQYYDVAVSDDYIKLFNDKVKEEFTNLSKDGKVKLDFNRFYYIGEKT